MSRLPSVRSVETQLAHAIANAKTKTRTNTVASQNLITSLNTINAQIQAIDNYIQTLQANIEDLNTRIENLQSQIRSCGTTEDANKLRTQITRLQEERTANHALMLQAVTALNEVTEYPDPTTNTTIANILDRVNRIYANIPAQMPAKMTLGRTMTLGKPAEMTLGNSPPSTRRVRELNSEVDMEDNMFPVTITAKEAARAATAAAIPPTAPMIGSPPPAARTQPSARTPSPVARRTPYTINEDGTITINNNPLNGATREEIQRKMDDILNKNPSKHSDLYITPGFINLVITEKNMRNALERTTAIKTKEMKEMFIRQIQENHPQGVTFLDFTGALIERDLSHNVIQGILDRLLFDVSQDTFGYNDDQTNENIDKNNFQGMPFKTSQEVNNRVYKPPTRRGGTRKNKRRLRGKKTQYRKRR